MGGRVRSLPECGWIWAIKWLEFAVVQEVNDKERERKSRTLNIENTKNKRDAKY